MPSWKRLRTGVTYKQVLSREADKDQERQPMTFRDACELAKEEANRLQETVFVVFKPEWYGPLSKEGCDIMTDSEFEATRQPEWSIKHKFTPAKVLGARKPVSEQKRDADGETHDQRCDRLRREKIAWQRKEWGYLQCEKCGTTFPQEHVWKVELHHLEKVGDGGEDTHENTALWCKFPYGQGCHQEHHASVLGA